MNEEMNCPLCNNHCKKEDLNCEKGKNYFSEQLNDEETKKNIPDVTQKKDRTHEGSHVRESGHEHGKHHGHEHENDGHEHHEEKEGGRHKHSESGVHGRNRIDFVQKDDLYSLLKECGHFLHSKSVHGDTQMEILHLLSHNDEIPQQDIQDMLRIRPGSVSEVITKLETKGFVERKKSGDDQRKIILAITDEGRKNCTEADEEENTEYFKSLSDQQKEDLKNILIILRKDWKEDQKSDN